MTLQRNIINNFNQLLTSNLSEVISKQSGKITVFKKGATIFNSGETINNLLFIESGDVKIVDYQNSNNVQYIKRFNYKGSLLDITGYLGRDNYLDTAIATTEVKLRAWSKEGVRQLSNYNIAFNAMVFQQILNENLKLKQRLSARFTLTSRQRVIDMLIELINEKGVKVGYDILVRSSLTHQEMASYTNTTRQTVTTVLNELRNKKILTFDRRSILFRDLDILKALLSEK